MKLRPYSPRGDIGNKSRWSDVVSKVIHESSRTASECALRFVSEHMTHAMQRTQSKTADYGAIKLWCLFPKSWWNLNVVKIIRIFYSLFSTKYIAFLLVKCLIWSERWKQDKQLRHLWNVTRVTLISVFTHWHRSMTRPKLPLVQM